MPCLFQPRNRLFIVLQLARTLGSIECDGQCRMPIQMTQVNVLSTLTRTDGCIPISLDAAMGPRLWWLIVIESPRHAGDSLSHLNLIPCTLCMTTNQRKTVAKEGLSHANLQDITTLRADRMGYTLALGPISPASPGQLLLDLAADPELIGACRKVELVLRHVYGQHINMCLRKQRTRTLADKGHTSRAAPILDASSERLVLRFGPALVGS